jgi:glycosyltransferase involved in cell wall biosynthesis
MRIAYLCADFGIPIRGHKGASVHVREMVAALAAQGHDVRVFAPNPGNGHSLAAPLHTISSTGLPDACRRVARHVARWRHPRLDKEARELAYNLTLYRHVYAQVRRWRPDAVYERYSLFNLSGLALARRLGVPHLLEVNAPLRHERARTKGLALAAVARLVERRLFGGSDAVLTVSTALRHYALEQGARPARTLVLPNAVDTRRFTPGDRQQVTGDSPGTVLSPDAYRLSPATRARLGLATDAFVVGFAGSLKPWHGTDVLLDAFARMKDHVPGARLLIVGEGPQGDALRTRAARLGIGTDVIFAGKVAHDAMPQMLAAMDVAVAPYLEVPDFYFSPLKLYEYMASGLAVVASDAGEIAALVRDGQTGILCPPGKVAALAAALLSLAHDSGLRAQLGMAARVEAERHSWSENARIVAEVAGARQRPSCPVVPGRGRISTAWPVRGQE